MKRFAPWLAVLLCVALVAGPFIAYASASREEGRGGAGGGGSAAATSTSMGVQLATTITQITGVALSPLLGVSAIGAWQWFRADAERRPHLPWFAQPKYWITGLVIVVLVMSKDVLGAVLPPGWKKPLDVLETLENKLSGLVAAGVFIPFTIGALTNLIGGRSADAGGGAIDAVLAEGSVRVVEAGVGASPLLAMVPAAVIDFSWLLNLLMVPLAVVVFVFVWVAAHAINVLILLSPWGAVDAVLKSIRAGVLSLLSITTWIDPEVGAVISVVLILFAYLVAGWAFRLTIYGSVFCWDFFTLRRHRFRPHAQTNWVFTARKIGKTPLRTYGQLSRNAQGRLELRYRPWLFLPERSVELPEVKLAVGRGALYPTVVGWLPRADGAEPEEKTLLVLSPRYKGHEAAFARACGIDTVIDVGMRRAWSVLLELFGLGTRTSSAAASPAQGG
jgi:hypothetical protein